MESVQIVGIGRFGAAVVGHLKRLRADVREAPHFALTTEGLLPARVNLLTSWRPDWDACKLLNRISIERKTPFVPFIQDLRTLTLGPIVVPHSGGCWECWLKRFLQHAPWADRRAALAQYYRASPGLGPRGYLDSIAMIGAARLSQVVDELDSGAAVAGELWQMDILTRRVSRSTVVGVHNCPWCGMQRARHDATFADMKEYLGGLWNEESGD